MKKFAYVLIFLLLFSLVSPAKYVSAEETIKSDQQTESVQQVDETQTEQSETVAPEDQTGTVDQTDESETAPAEEAQDNKGDVSTGNETNSENQQIEDEAVKQEEETDAPAVEESEATDIEVEEDTSENEEQTMRAAAAQTAAPVESSIDLIGHLHSNAIIYSNLNDMNTFKEAASEVIQMQSITLKSKQNGIMKRTIKLANNQAAHLV